MKFRKMFPTNIDNMDNKEVTELKLHRVPECGKLAAFSPSSAQRA